MTEWKFSLANPSLVTLFPSHNGLVHVDKVPSPHTILSPSDKYSTLRGMSCSAGVDAGSGENNLGLRCTRKRLIIETMHLDVEGGVAERRTTPAPNAQGLHVNLSEGPTVQVEMDEVTTASSTTNKTQKTKKRVAFHSDQPDLYDF